MHVIIFRTKWVNIGGTVYKRNAAVIVGKEENIEVLIISKILTDKNKHISKEITTNCTHTIVTIAHSLYMTSARILMYAMIICITTCSIHKYKSASTKNRHTTFLYAMIFFCIPTKYHKQV